MVDMVALCACGQTQEPSQTPDAPVADDQPAQQPSENEQPSEEAPVQNTNPTYTVKIVDEGGNPVVGAMVQMCQGETCMPGPLSDATGTVIFQIPDSGRKHAHVFNEEQTAHTAANMMQPSRRVPMWELTYHGILLYNPCTLTVNYPIKDKDAEITYGLYGGKPSFYVYSKFLTEGRNWMGNEDFFLDDEASTALTVESIKRASDAFLENADLQLEFINRYEETESGLKVMKYENGAVVIGNYTDTALEYCGFMIPARSYTVRR